MSDEWKAIPHFGMYLINVRGEVKRVSDGKMLKYNKSVAGYSLSYSLLTDRGDKTSRTVKGLMEAVFGVKDWEIGDER